MEISGRKEKTKLNVTNGGERNGRQAGNITKTKKKLNETGVGVSGSSKLRLTGLAKPLDATNAVG